MRKINISQRSAPKHSMSHFGSLFSDLGDTNGLVLIWCSPSEDPFPSMLCPTLSKNLQFRRHIQV